MKAVIVQQFGSSDQLQLQEVADVFPSENEIKIKVHATALNRADILQREGKYPPPKGASEILGLEAAGEVVALGEKVSKWKIGDRVMVLLAGGGYAEQVVVHENVAMPVAEAMTFEEAAAIPEAFLTAFQALRLLADVQDGENILIHAGASGVGTAAIQLAKAMGASVWVTASAKKHTICKALGADFTIDYQTEKFDEIILQEKKGVDVIIDFMAASYFKQNVEVLRPDGRMVLLALMGGYKGEVNFAKILTKRLKIMGSTLRARSIAYKSDLIDQFWKFAEPLFLSQELKPVIDCTFFWEDVQRAHQYMEANKNQEK